ncbi:pro-Pol polyprotein [Trichonephila clavipes]|nr:pro-Pol polyprotein [Trichonephila clavipes]
MECGLYWPLEPPSRRNHHFIICAVDLCTRWAEAIPVKEISAKTTCNVLLKIFTQTGFPKMICSDQGTNFTSKLSEMFLSVMGFHHVFLLQGILKVWVPWKGGNRTLKDMLSKNVQEHGSDWDLHLPLLFAYREIPHSTTGMSPFQLVYGRLPSGPYLFSRKCGYGCIIYGDVTDHISSDCQELDDVQRLELLNTLGKFSSLFSSLPGLAKVKGHNLKLKPDFTPKKMHLPHTYCFAARSRSSDQ